jgi:hypothetical protein
MAQVLTTSAQVKCQHGGMAVLTSSSKLAVSGTKVLLKAGVGQLTSPVCPNSGGPPTPDLNVSITTGLSQKLMSDGNPVLLSTLTGTGDGSPPGTVSATESQTKLMAS